MRFIIAFGRFWYDFLIGDRPELFIGPIVALAVVGLLAQVGAAAIGGLVLFGLVVASGAWASRVIWPPFRPEAADDGVDPSPAGLFLLALVGADTPLPEIALWLAICGIGQGLFLSPNSSAVMSAVPAEESGTASGLIATTRVVGQSLSVAIAGAMFVGLGGAVAGAALAAGGASGVGAGASLDATFLGALRPALFVSDLFAAAGALMSLPRR